jgi:ketosteroid isomerase-like protein
MSEANIEVVRRIYESLTRGDDAWRELAAQDLVVDFSRRRVDPFVAHGLNDPVLTTFQTQTSEVWEGPPTWEPVELIGAGDKVFAFIRTRGRGKGSGALVEAQVANVWTFRDGKVIDFTYFGEDRAAAVQAAGLRG